MTRVKTLRPGDPDFNFTAGIVMSGRAGIEIDKQCPAYVEQLIVWAIENKYIRPVAFMKDDEYVWEKIKA